MPKEVKQYPEGTYGFWMQQQIKVLAMYLGQMKNPGLNARQIYGAEKGVVEAYASLAIMQRTMMGAQQQLKMTDRMGEHVRSLLKDEVEAHKEDKEYMEPFDYDRLDQTIERLGMNGKEPPTPEDMLQNLANMRQERETATQEPGQRQPEQQKKGIYPPGTYGAWLHEKNKQLAQRVRDIQERANDPAWRAEHQNDKVPEGQPAYYNTDLQMGLWQFDAATIHSQISVMQQMMADGKRSLTDKLPPDAEMDKMIMEAGNQGSKREFLEPFHIDMVNKTAAYFGLDWKIPPRPDFTLQRVGALREAREQAGLEHAMEKAQLQQERQAAAKLLVGDLKQSAQKSFVGKLKSFFVGNSKEYKEAFQAVQDIAGGNADPKVAKDKIWKYLDLRGNKARDHQYGRDRFDAMMSALALVTSKEEFEKRCGAIDEARRVRSKGTYKGTIDPEKYSLAAQKQREEALIRDDPQRIANEKNYGRAYYDYLDQLRKAKTATPELEAFALEHPGVREAARAIAEQNGLEIKIPKTPENLGKEAKEALQEQQREARDLASRMPELEREEPSRQPEPQRQSGGMSRGIG